MQRDAARGRISHQDACTLPQAGCISAQPAGDRAMHQDAASCSPAVKMPQRLGNKQNLAQRYLHGALRFQEVPARCKKMPACYTLRGQNSSLHNRHHRAGAGFSGGGGRERSAAEPPPTHSLARADLAPCAPPPAAALVDVVHPFVVLLLVLLVADLLDGLVVVHHHLTDLAVHLGPRHPVRVPPEGGRAEGCTRLCSHSYVLLYVITCMVVLAAAVPLASAYVRLVTGRTIMWPRGGFIAGSALVPAHTPPPLPHRPRPARCGGR
eukprot:gene17906-biopygen8108